MGPKRVRLDEDVYERIRQEKREDETFSEAIDRLTTDSWLSEWSTDRTEEEIAQHEELLEAVDKRSEREIDDLLEDLGIEVE
jgi:predicted CopG family antitoxin